MKLTPEEKEWLLKDAMNMKRREAFRAAARFQEIPERTLESCIEFMDDVQTLRPNPPTRTPTRGKEFRL